MPKYDFSRLTAESFETLVQALIEKNIASPGVIHFGPGPDGGREATWAQPPEHATYVPLPNGDVRGRNWVFQAKYHDTVRARTKDAVRVLAAELDSELLKVTEHHEVACDSYVLLTNLPLTGVRHSGGRDVLEARAERWRAKELEVHIWDANKLSTLLDGSPDVRQTYLDQVVPGDVLAEVLDNLRSSRRREAQVVRAYLKSVVETAGVARADEAGDEAEKPLRLEKVYIDLTLVGPEDSSGERHSPWHQFWRHRSPLDGDVSAPLEAFGKRTTTRRVLAPAACAVLLDESSDTVLIQAGPGYGKSTIGQFVATLQSARLLGAGFENVKRALFARVLMPLGFTEGQLDGLAELRIPFRVELRRYADWRAKQAEPSLAEYVATQLVNPASDGNFGKQEVFDLCKKNPVVLVLDGLDEVPNADQRAGIIADTQVFLRRVGAGSGRVQLLCSTRPQGYDREFEAFEPRTYTIQDLRDEQFEEYCRAWLDERVADPNERSDALERVRNGLESPDVRRLAATLLQATVILTIAKNKHDIPHERSGLFHRYVDTIFEREKSKQGVVKTYEHELRRLHEAVGYQLHSEMETGGGGTLTSEEFERSVTRVWLEYRGEQPLDKGLRPVVKDIVEAARNRVVFLAGEGEKQEQIGFAISSFREYFAACHMAQDETAERKRVFDALLEREGHWENVLCFYAGLQQPADQRSWAKRVRARSNDSDLVGKVRLRRLLLRVLGEFRPMKPATFKAVISECLATDTLWSWTESGQLGAYLASLRGGNGALTAIELLREQLDGPKSTEATRVWGHIVAAGGPLRDEFALHLASRATRNGDSYRTICEALEFDVPVRWEADATTWIEAAISVGGALSEDTASAIPSDVVVGLFLRRYPDEWVGHPLMEVLSKNVSLAVMSQFGGPEPFCRDPEVVLAALEDGLGPHAQALRALIRASGSIDRTLDEEARRACSKIDHDRLPETVLGPDATFFESEADWVDFRTRVPEVCRSRAWQTYRARVKGNAAGGSSWLLWLTQPNVWPELTRAGLLNEADVSEINDEIKHVLNLPKRPVCLGPAGFFRPGTSKESLSAKVFFDAMLGAAEAIGAENIGSFRWELARLDPDITGADCVRFVSGIQKHALAHGWLALLVRMAGQSPLVDDATFASAYQEASGLDCRRLKLPPGPVTVDRCARMATTHPQVAASMIEFHLGATRRNEVELAPVLVPLLSILRAPGVEPLAQEQALEGFFLAGATCDAELSCWQDGTILQVLSRSADVQAALDRRLRRSAPGTARVPPTALEILVNERRLAEGGLARLAVEHLVALRRKEARPLKLEDWQEGEVE